MEAVSTFCFLLLSQKCFKITVGDNYIKEFLENVNKLKAHIKREEFFIEQECGTEKVEEEIAAMEKEIEKKDEIIKKHLTSLQSWKSGLQQINNKQKNLLEEAK